MEQDRKPRNKPMCLWSVNPTPGHISGENPTSKRYVHPIAHCSTIYNSQDMKAT